ncbi:hypothetical protein I5E68_07085 [Novosphingobium sp. YJ-S2-02]|uniref:Uncharacterized protein n=1 Tax=Novosphingobium aureum TaxID=2792964 RepID=A0A931HBH0_9SPHN|nr:hypothetical protein [Novosphingobium aureum]MBH0112714.1 hypothetical protein [Novosphingobium aureum]
MLDAAFAQIGLAFGEAFGGIFWDARVITNTPAEYDDGGSIIAPGGVEHRPCKAQVDAATQTMRQAEGFTEKDRRIIVLAGTLEGEISTEERIEFLEGPFEGVWMIEAVARDTGAAGFELRGRKA